MMKQKRETRQQNIDSSSKWPQSKQETNMDLGNVTITFDIRHAGGIEQDAIVLPRVSFNRDRQILRGGSNERRAKCHDLCMHYAGVWHYMSH